MLHDLLLAARSLLRAPLFTAAAALVLGLGLGVGAVVFSAVDSVLFRPIPLPRPDRLVRVFASPDGRAGFASSSHPVFQDYDRDARSFSGLAAYTTNVRVNVSAQGEARPQIGRAAMVGAGFFPLLGARPASGRLLGPEDDRQPGGHPVVVLSHAYALSRFGTPAAALSQELRVNGRIYAVVGVTESSFFGADLDHVTDLWLPLSMAEQAMPGLAGLSLLTSRNVSWLDIVGRLKDGVPLQAAQAELDVLARNRAAAQPENQKDPFARLVPMSAALLSSDLEPRSAAETSARFSWLLLGAAMLVLVLAGSVVAGLLAVRAERRRDELAVRQAIGASRFRLVRHLLAESAALAVPAAGAGLLAALFTQRLLVAAAPADVPLPLAAATPVLALRVAAATALASLVLSCLFGLVPALFASRRGVNGRGETRRRRLSLGGSFVVFQVALSTVLLAGAGLLLRTLLAAAATDPGFPVEGALVAELDVARQGYARAEGERRLAAVLERVRAIPGVSSAGLARTVPVQRSGMRSTVRVPGFVATSVEEENVEFNVATPGARAAMGVPLARGRDISEEDRQGAPRVAVVNEAFVRRFWPGEDGLGKRLLDMGPNGETAEVVGVVKDVKLRSLRETPGPELTVPHAQVYFPGMTLVVRTAPGHDPRALVPALHAAVAAVDPDLPLFAPRTLREHVGATLGKERLLAALLLSFGALALVLAAFGLFGVLSYAAEARRREIGIRMAVGARVGDVVGLVAAEGARLGGAGLVLGLGGALALAPLLSHLLLGVSPHDPLTLAGVALALAVAALLATTLPAWRAARVNPATALRAE